MKILAFAGSNSSKSINFNFVKYVAGQIKNHEVNVVDLRDFAAPVYGLDLEEASGIPEEIRNLQDLIQQHDALIISVAEHNGGLTAFLKSTLDWLSRHVPKYFGEKKVLVLGTTPGQRGAASAREMLEKMIGYAGGETVASFGLPKYYDNVISDPAFAIKDETLDQELREVITSFETSLA